MMKNKEKAVAGRREEIKKKLQEALQQRIRRSGQFSIKAVKSVTLEEEDPPEAQSNGLPDQKKDAR
jgi:hypothetical protein